MNLRESYLVKFFSAEAFEQRARDRERRQLAGELEQIAADRAYNDAREAQILKRSSVLDRLDSVAAFNATRQAARGTYIFESGHADPYPATMDGQRRFWALPGAQQLGTHSRQVAK